MTSRTYTVAGMTCGHCVASVSAEIGALPGVEAVVIDLASGQVVVRSEQALDDVAVQAAVEEAGYEVVAP